MSVKHLLLIGSILLTLLAIGRSEEQPPYETEDPRINENFRQIYLHADKISVISYSVDGNSDSFCIDRPSLCIDTVRNVVAIGSVTTTGSNQLLLMDGSVGAPSVSFQSNPASGMFLKQSGIVGISANGSPAIIAASTGVAILATNTNNTAGVNDYGALVSTNNPNFIAAAATDNFGNVVSTVIAGGDWMISGQLEFRNNGATETAGPIGAISVNSGNSTGDHVDALNQFQTSIPSAAGFTSVNILYHLQVSGTTTIYLKSRRAYSAGTPQNAGTLFAWRIR